MKKLRFILGIVIVILFSTVKTSSGILLAEPLPTISTDREYYFPNESIQVNSNWKVFFDETEELEIVIILSNYSLGQNALKSAAEEALCLNLSISCPV